MHFDVTRKTMFYHKKSYTSWDPLSQLYATRWPWGLPPGSTQSTCTSSSSPSHSHTRMSTSRCGRKKNILLSKYIFFFSKWKREYFSMNVCIFACKCLARIFVTNYFLLHKNLFFSKKKIQSFSKFNLYLRDLYDIQMKCFQWRSLFNVDEDVPWLYGVVAVCPPGAAPQLQLHRPVVVPLLL